MITSVWAAVRTAIVAAAVLSANVTPACGETSKLDWGSLFFDEQDGYFDVSNLLARGGFFPVPIIITEPAVDNGFGLAAYFVRNPEPGSGRPPERSVVGGARTGNGSNGFGLMHSGSFFDGNLLYNVAAATGLAVLDFHPGNRNLATRYNNDIDYIGASARYRIGASGFSAGPTIRYRRNDVVFDLGEDFPGADPFLGRETDLVAAGLELHYDDRDNPLTPTRGSNVIAAVQRFDEALGSDVGFTSLSLLGAWFGTWESWTLGAMARLQATEGGAPFFMEPDINIRGLARNRYTGDRVLSTELELRRRITPRWSVLGFVGYGRATNSGSVLSESGSGDAAAFGAGFRYRVARKLGLDVGIDVARGPDDTVVYIQFGHAWAPSMD